MNDVPMIITGATQQLYGLLLVAFARSGLATEAGDEGTGRDRGAVSLEQVLWFVAAGVSVAVIATILWNQIRDQANTPVETPVAPTP